MIVGLADPAPGNIYICGRLVNDVASGERSIAMVFQDYALYPHMVVCQNMKFALKLKKMPKAQIDQRVREAAGISGIQNLLDRKQIELSRQEGLWIEAGPFRLSLTSLKQKFLQEKKSKDNSRCLVRKYTGQYFAEEENVSFPIHSIVDVIETLGDEVHLNVNCEGHTMVARIDSGTKIGLQK